MRFFGVFFLALLLSTTITGLDIFLNGSFLINFIDNNYIETFSALIGFNLASVTFLLGQLITIEATVMKDSLFDGTRKQIKDNSFFLIISLIVVLILLVIRPDLIPGVNFNVNIFYFIVNNLVITIFLMALYSVYEILNSVFSVGKFFNSK